jgi:hypothetical protein
MEDKQPSLVRNRVEAVIVTLVVVGSISAGSAVLAQDTSAKPSTPPAADNDKMGMGGCCGGGKMGGMAGMQRMMEGCGRGMDRSHMDRSQTDRSHDGADEKKPEDTK